MDNPRGSGLAKLIRFLVILRHYWPFKIFFLRGRGVIDPYPLFMDKIHFFIRYHLVKKKFLKNCQIGYIYL